MKNELERIWIEEPLAFSTHLAGWKVIHTGISFWLNEICNLIAVKGRKINPIRKIHRIWR